MLNHSCQFTCSVVNHTLCIDALTDVQSGNELTILYIDTDDNVAARHQNLQEVYNLNCQCKRWLPELNAISKPKQSTTGLCTMRSLLQQAKRIEKQATTGSDGNAVQQYVNKPFQLTPLSTPLNANNYILWNTNQVRYIPNVITEADEHGIVQLIQATPQQRWTQLRNRRLQQWGGTVTAQGLTNIETIPQYTQQCVHRVQALNIFSSAQQPNHVLLNQYEPAQGISPHKDGPLYTPIVTILSLNSTVLLKFYASVPNGSQMNDHVFSVLCEPRSVVVFNNDVYAQLWHSIDMTDIDVIDERVLNRHLLSKQYEIGDTVKRDATRYSLTMRHVPVAKSAD